MMKGAGVGMEKDGKGGGAGERLSTETKSQVYGYASPGYARGVCDAVRRNTLGFVKTWWLASFIFSLGDARVDAKSRKKLSISPNHRWHNRNTSCACIYPTY